MFGSDLHRSQVNLNHQSLYYLEGVLNRGLKEKEIRKKANKQRIESGP
jgi:hypothetical protein